MAMYIYSAGLTSGYYWRSSEVTVLPLNFLITNS